MMDPEDIDEWYRGHVESQSWHDDLQAEAQAAAQAAKDKLGDTLAKADAEAAFEKAKIQKMAEEIVESLDTDRDGEISTAEAAVLFSDILGMTVPNDHAALRVFVGLSDDAKRVQNLFEIMTSAEIEAYYNKHLSPEALDARRAALQAEEDGVYEREKREAAERARLLQEGGFRRRAKQLLEIQKV